MRIIVCVKRTQSRNGYIKTLLNTYPIAKRNADRRSKQAHGVCENV